MISILSLYTEGDLSSSYPTQYIRYISILSLYTEGDYLIRYNFEDYNYFNPLPLYRGRHSIPHYG